MQIDPQEQWRLLIGGDGVATSDTYEVVDPSTTSVVGHAPEATVADAEAAIAAANQALPGWRSTPMADRCALLGRLSDILAERSGDWASLVQAETGATMKIAQTLQLGGTFVDRFRYYSRPRDLDVAEKPMPAGASALGPAGLVGAVVHRQPVGVVACITPYNFPLVNVAGKIAPALTMGNTCIIKPAPQD
ncbi:MAG: aldehyde dehydrogenase family protein, partial [Actinomycetota bacterium]|nr:aldehyde dehydrogenase family protein [Actinomycetota bacterium]